MRAAKVQASLRIRAVSPEPSLLAHTSRESRGTFRQKARSLAPLNDWACAVKICHDGMLEDRNSIDAAHLMFVLSLCSSSILCPHTVVSCLNILFFLVTRCPRRAAIFNCGTPWRVLLVSYATELKSRIQDLETRC